MKLTSAFAQTLGVQVVQSALSVSIGVAIARALGPLGQGTYAMLATAVLLGALIGSLGQFQGNVLVAAGQPVPPAIVLVRSVLHALVIGVSLLAISYLWTGWKSLGVARGVIDLCVLVTTVEILAQLIRGINLGQHHVLAYNVSTFLQRAIQAAGVGALWGTHSMTVGRAMAVWVTAALASVVFSSEWIRRRNEPTRIVYDAVFRGWAAKFGQGSRAFAAVAFVMLLIRCDIWMLQPMLGTRVVGQFSVATSLAEWLWYVPTIVGNLLFAVVAADGGKTSATTVARITRVALALALPCAAALMIGGRALVALLYGSQYAAAGVLFVALVPGMTAIAVHLVVDSYFAGLGFPPQTIWAAAIALLAKVGLNFVFVPAFGAVGAAAATCTVYIGLLVYKLVWFRSATALPFRKILVATPADLSAGLNEVKAWWRRRRTERGLSLASGRAA